MACADELDKILRISGAETVAGFICEPVVGATLGAAAPPEGYLQRIAEICKRHGILLIADEVMTGMGRTGKVFACEHWGIEPDMILVGKGVASGMRRWAPCWCTGMWWKRSRKDREFFCMGSPTTHTRWRLRRDWQCWKR